MSDCVKLNFFSKLFVDFFSKLFVLLVRNKMGGAALPMVGFAVGLFLIEMTRAAPTPYVEHVGYVGLRLIDVSALVFCFTMVGFAVLWLMSIRARHKA